MNGEEPQQQAATNSEQCPPVLRRSERIRRPVDRYGL